MTRRAPDHRSSGRPGEVFRAFLRLGCTAFGGPVAHLGYFEREFVSRRKWLDAAAYADLVALCQFLPGPASSQVAFAVGWKRARWLGAGAAWLGFTLPSAILMFALACGLQAVGDLAHAGWVQGLKVAAVAVVAQAVVAMARRLCPSLFHAAIALIATALLIFRPVAAMQVAVIAGGACAGLLTGPRASPASSPKGPAAGNRLVGFTCLGLFLGLLVTLPWLARAWSSPALRVAAAFYRSGALVFGGGHVVLPLLQQATVAPGWLPSDVFLAGYGAAQALPGPLFAFAAYLGALIAPGGLGGAAVALGAIYLPGGLILAAALPSWEWLSARPGARRLLAGANAAVVGLLAAALYSPIATSTLANPVRLGLALGALAALQFPRMPSWAVVVACAAAGAIWLA